jgi:hypothetical protein
MDSVDLDDLLSRLKEVEELLRFPGVSGHVERAGTLALSIARKAPNGATANLAMQVITEANALRRSALPVNPEGSSLNSLVSRLRLALQEAKGEAR